ncbi:phosphotransferase enzyme family protein [Streptomyces litchfieldiae]|uniref:Phosphotransferase n=1 Tax=Streptomyces litchfieldiae TaxID=3075543 RepID=A0ABU2MZZ6_9ACTN|nr:phosphotransferase [Streptomyces sp. DSM 44938]MDT0347209.1 phosphotransferase [Streptomyces sp. DSM 44938]
MRTDPEVLAGGMANAGAVMRRGELVERPAPRNAPAIHAFLGALRQRGFDAAPAPVRILAGGREELTYLPGEVALPPFPAWAMTDTALRSVGSLLRRLHEAGAAVPVDADAGWARELADPEGGEVLCHNDVCPENVVFRDGRAAALIDFDLAAPGRPVWDVAMTARYWVPMLDPVSASGSYPAGLDAPARLRLLADGYGLSTSERAVLPRVIEEATERGRAFVAGRIAAGDPVYVQAMAENGGWERWDRMQSWQAAHRESFTAALLR